jgi:hypothetical protein
MKIEIRTSIPINSLKLNYKCKSGTVDDSNKCSTNFDSSKSDSEYARLSDVTKNIINKDGTGKLKDALKEYIFNSGSVTYLLAVKKEKVGSTKIPNTVRDTIKGLDTLISKSVLGESVQTFSGVSPTVWKELPKEVGSEFSINSFVSTSVDPNVAKAFSLLRQTDMTSRKYLYGEWKKPSKGYYLEIRMKPGDHGLATREFSREEFPNTVWPVVSKKSGELGFDSYGGESGNFDDAGSQEEMILPRDQKFRVVGVEKERGTAKRYFREAKPGYEKLILETI